jgi:hypothetical protein
MTPETMAKDLASLKPFLHFNRIQLVGGEPTLHPELPELLRVAKKSGVGDFVSIITNGALLPKMEDEFWNELQILQLSVYGKLDKSVIPFAQEKARKHGFDFYMAEFTEFYVQFKPVPDDGADSFRNCHWKMNCFTVHEGHFYLCPQAAFFPALFQDLPERVDGFPLDGLTEEKLEAYMNRQEPFNACKVCLGSVANRIPWREAKNKEDWIKGSTL